MVQVPSQTLYQNLAKLCFFRNPDPLLRPSYMDITAQLQKPDYQVLKWSEEAGVHSCSSSEAKVIGATLEAGCHLHQDLQKAYIVTN